MNKTNFIVYPLILLLCLTFYLQEELVGKQDPLIHKYLPATVHRTSLGVFSELGVYLQFIKTTIFIGSRFHGSASSDDFGDELSHNFKVMTTVHPHFKDLYFLCQSSIAHISPYHADIAATILLDGAEYFPNDFFLSFFAAFDYFFHRGDNRKAAQVLQNIQQSKNDAPDWLGHLAAVLSAKAGDLQAALITLQIMEKATTEESEKKRYRSDIKTFAQAIRVQNAVDEFYMKEGNYPVKLGELVPDFMKNIPDIGSLFVMELKENRVILRRPSKEEQQKEAQKPIIFL